MGRLHEFNILTPENRDVVLAEPGAVLQLIMGNQLEAAQLHTAEREARMAAFFRSKLPDIVREEAIRYILSKEGVELKAIEENIHGNNSLAFILPHIQDAVAERILDEFESVSALRSPPVVEVGLFGVSTAAVDLGAVTAQKNKDLKG